jgi:hypothetical protein
MARTKNARIKFRHSKTLVQKPYCGQTGKPAVPRKRGGYGMFANASGSLFYVNYFAPFVEPAFRTDAVLHARLLTVRTGDRLWYPQGIVRPAFPAT